MFNLVPGNDNFTFSCAAFLFFPFPRGSTFLGKPSPPAYGRFRNRLSTVGTTPWTRGRPVARSLPTQDSTTQKDENKHPCFEWDSNTESQYPSGQDPLPRQRGHCVRPYTSSYGECNAITERKIKN
jgi:hypothetical protein